MKRVLLLDNLDRKLFVEYPDSLSEKRSNIMPHYLALKKKGYIQGDWAKRLAGQKELCKIIAPEVTSFADGMVGVGVAAAVIEKYTGAGKILLNDLDEVCVGIARKNFPKASIMNLDINNWDFGKVDLLVVDFNRFTLNHLYEGWWSGLFKRIEERTPKYFMFLDTAIFGFRFSSNREQLGISEDYLDYYKLLSKRLYQECGMRVSAVSIFGKMPNVAVVLASQKRSRKIQIIKPTLPLSIANYSENNNFI